MNRRELALTIALPLTILFEGVSSYVGHNYFDIMEANPFFYGIEGTWNSLVFSALLSYLVMTKMLGEAKEYKLLEFPRGMAYKTLLVVWMLFLVSNLQGIIL